MSVIMDASMKRSALAAALALHLAACATVQHGPMQRIPVDSEPQDALVRTADCGPGATKEVRTPGVVWVSRRAERCMLTFASRDHYTEQVTLTRELSEKFFENAEVAADLCCTSGDDWLGFFLGGLFAGTGFAVDTATGALYEQHPSEVFVELEPVEDGTRQQ
jgi:hypothetical protein